MAEANSEWLRDGWLFQQEWFQQMGNRTWDRVDNNEQYLLDKLRVAFEICCGRCYQENKVAKKLTDRVETEALKLFKEREFNDKFACTFVNILLKETDIKSNSFCVFWLQKADGSERCLDLSGRNYESWDDFLKNNTLPKCYLMYPKGGKYVGNKDLFIDILVSESVACSAKNIAKNVLDVVSMLGGAAAAGVLVLNPAGATILLGASAVTLVTGAYSVGNGINRLVDIHNHDGGLSLTESKTLLTVGEIAVSAVGAGAAGVAAGVKGIAAKAGTILSEGSVAFKLASNVGKISRVFSGVNVGFSVIVVVDNYQRNGCLTSEDRLHLMRILFFSFNVIVTENLICQLIDYLSNMAIDKIIKRFINSPYRLYESINRIYRFLSSDDLHRLIELIFPNFYNVTEKISNIKPLVDRVAIIADHTLRALRTRHFDLDYVYFLQEQLFALQTEITSFTKKNDMAIKSKFDDNTLKLINEWTRNDGIGLNNNSSFVNKINTPNELKKTSLETIAMCSKQAESEVMLAERELFLFSEIFKLVKLNGLKDSTYVIKKFNFYCDKFQNLHNEMMDLYHYQYFIFTVDNGSDLPKEVFFFSQFDFDNIHDFVYEQSLQSLKDNIKSYHEEFEKDFVCDQSADQEEGKVVYEFEMPSISHAGKEEFYSKAKELIPKLELKLNDESTTFNDLGDLAIIKSNQDDFVLFFYTQVENNCLKGILLWLKV